MNKKLVVLLLIVAFVLILARKINPPAPVVTTVPQNLPKMQEITNAFKWLLDKGYSRDYVADIERLFRLETAHFKSGQFQKGYSPGMVASGMVYPWGWSSLKTFASAMNLSPDQFKITPPFAPSGFKYVMFPDFIYSLAFVAWFIKNKRNGVVENWNSLDTAKANAYRAKLNQITPKIVNSL